jgi:predicted permease
MTFRHRQEDDLDREIRDYIERETNANIALGMPTADARHAAMRKFGRPALNVKEDTRAVWGWIWLERLWQDLRHGTRMLRKTPGFTFVAVLSLAIGIGANSAMFSFADALLFRPLPVLRPSEVVTVNWTSPTGHFGEFTFSAASYRDYADLRDRSRSFTGLAAFTIQNYGLSTRADQLPQLRMGLLMTGNFFQVMGVAPALGRAFLPEEDRVPGRDAVVVLSHDCWQKQFAADPSVLGRKVWLNGVPFTIIGVAPERFTGMDQVTRPSFYVPIMMWPRLTQSPQDRPLEARDQRSLTIKGRLRSGVSTAQAEAELVTIAKDLERAYPDTNHNQTVNVRTEIATRIQQSPPDAMFVAMLCTLAGAVLLVACANVAGLLLSRVGVRSREIALRLAIGASRRRLIRQLLTESLLIALAGGLAGLGVGYAGAQLFHRIQIPSDLPIVISFQVDRRALLFSLAVAFLSTILFGLIPALQTTRTDLISALKTSGTNLAGHRRLWGRNFLVVGQVAVSLVLLVVSTTLFRGFRSELLRGPGYRTDHLLMMSFDPSLVHYTEAQSQQFYQQLVERARLVPGVKSATLTFAIPLGADSGDFVAMIPEGFHLAKGQEGVSIFANSVGENYFETMNIPLVDGRGLLVTDTANAPHVAVVNETFARHYWPGQSAVGKRFRINDATGPWLQIVGVAKTSKYFWITEPPMEFVYLPLAQRPHSHMRLLVQSVGPPGALSAPLREVVHSLDANQPIYDVRTMQEYFDVRAVRTCSVIVETVGAMGVMGVLLSIIGLYGLVAYAAGRRTREIGIRMAIGAQRSTVLRMMMRQGLVLALIGTAIGFALALAAIRTMTSSFIFSFSPANGFLTYLLVVPALLAVTLLAAYIPARRASRVDPTTALRYE